MIKVEHLTKYYGDYLAVDDLSFEIEEGHVYGFLGPNGAGKSTTMNIITGCLSATDGKISIDGHDVFDEPKEAKRCIGYLPEQPPLYMNETPFEYLKFVAMAKGLRGEELYKQIDDVVSQTGIEGVRDKLISALSKGYRQRVGIAQALLGNPKVIILDEPTVGLDPLQIIEIRELIKSLGNEHTVILSSHILSEVQAICDEIIMIAGGRLVAYDTPENLERQMLSQNEISITTDADEDTIKEILKDEKDITEIMTEERTDSYTDAVIRSDQSDMYDLSALVFKAFAKSSHLLLEMKLKKAALEDIFIELAEVQESPEVTEDSITEREGDEISEEKEEKEV